MKVREWPLVFFTVNMTRAGAKIELLNKGSFLEPHNHEQFFGVDGDFTGAAASGQPDFRFCVRTNDS